MKTPIIITLEKPIDVSKALEILKNELAKRKIPFNENELNELNGHIEYLGSKAKYEVKPSVIELTIDKRTPLPTESKIREAVDKYWKKYLADEKAADGKHG